MKSFSTIQDGGGIYGSIFHYTLVIFFVAGAFILFLYLWKKGRLDMDEEPKHQMLKDDEEKDSDDQQSP